MSSATRVLVFPAGEQNAAEAIQALSKQVNIEIFGAGSSARLGPYLLFNYEGNLATIQHPEFSVAMNSLIARWQIDLILPTHDSVVTFLAELRPALNAIPMVPSMSTSAICRDKSLFYEAFQSSHFIPHVYRQGQDGIPETVWAKPRMSQGGSGGRLIHTSMEGWQSLIDWDSEVVSEYLPGPEITVDCFSDYESRLQGTFPRSRDRTLGGISVAGTALASTETIAHIAEEINSKLKFVGMWYFQARETSDGRLKVMEISARIPGGQILTRARGVNLPLLSVYAHLGKPTRVFENPFTVANERIFASAFAVDYEYESVYLDLDDTLIIDGKPNVELLSLLYQWRNSGKNVILLTRHERDPEETLEAHSIHRRLFDRLIRLDPGARKSSFISPARSIFIDNAFSERAEVHDSLGIPVLDVSEVEILRSWRR